MWKAVEFDNAAKERIRQAARTESRNRLDAYVCAAIDLGDIEVRQMTARDVLEMEYAENRLFCGGIADDTDYAHFFWSLRPAYCKTGQARYVRKALRLIRKDKSIIGKVSEFIELQFADMPSGNGSTRNEYQSGVWLSPLVDTFASEYGWSIDHILDQPVGRLFQLMQYITVRRMRGKFSVSNPITQKAKADEMRRLQHG